MVLKILESDYNADVYLFYAVKEPDTINIMCASEYLMLPSASLMRPSCVHASGRFCNASVRRLSASALRLLCVCFASALRQTCVPPAFRLRLFHALPASFVGQLY